MSAGNNLPGDDELRGADRKDEVDFRKKDENLKENDLDTNGNQSDDNAARKRKGSSGPEEKDFTD